MTPPTRPRAAIAFIFITAVLDITALGVVIPVLPGLIEEFAGSDAQAGWINGVFVALWAGMQLIASPVIGSLSDRYGRRPVLLLSAAGLSLDFVLMALAPDLRWLAVGRMIAGVTSSSFTTCFAYMADVTPPEQRSRAYGLVGAAFSTGFVLGPVIGGFFGEISPRAPFWAAAALCGLNFLYGLLVLPESLPKASRMAFSWRRANPFGAVRLLGRDRQLTGLAAVNFFLYFGHHIFSTVFVLYLGDRYGWGPIQVGALLAMAGVLEGLTQTFLVGPLVKRLGDGAVMVLSLLVGAVTIVGMGLAVSGLWFIAAMIPNALWALSMPTLQALMSRRVSESEQGQLQGANNSVGSVASVISPLIFGAVYAASVARPPQLPHIGSAWFLGGVMLTLAAAVGWWVLRAGPPPPLAQPDAAPT